MADSLARKVAQQERDSKYEEFWRGLSRAGDPARIPNKVRTGYNAGWDAAESALAPMREALQAIVDNARNGNEPGGTWVIVAGGLIERAAEVLK
jgi:hypothetical protein